MLSHEGPDRKPGCLVKILEMAGSVAAAGSAVQGWRPGGRVMALLPGGGYAEQAALQAGERLLVHAGASGVGTAAIRKFRRSRAPVRWQV
jgi:NADPH:quinone reductase-like Zn-dependent oxidoreductase